MKKSLDKRVLITKNSVTTLYEFEEALKEFNLTKRQLEQRATKELCINNLTFKWNDSSTKRSFIGKSSRRKGNSWERQIVNDLKSIGYPNCVSSRSESKRMDDAKVDIIDLDGQLNCHIQAKATKNLPNYHKIREDCPLKDKPLVIACKQPEKTPIVILELSYFYQLIKK